MSTAIKKDGPAALRFAYDPERERYCPDLEHELREVLADLRHNEMMFNLETDPDLVEQRIYERQALRCRYRYLIENARRLGLHTILRSDA